MIRSFKSPETEALFNGRRVARFTNPEKVATRKLQMLDDAVELSDLMAPPANLLEATHELEGCSVLRKALGRGRDEDYVDYFLRVKRDEWARYHEQVTPWEVAEYLTRF